MSHTFAYDINRPFYLPPRERYPGSQARQALEAVYSAGKPILIYVHGRAKGLGEPRKSVETGIYDALDGYGVSVLGFTWDADDAGYDETRPLASAEAFDGFLDVLTQFIGEHPGQRAKPALLAHSMGNLILAELAKDGRLGAARGALFTNMVFNAAAVKVKRHHLWLDAIHVSERKYVMVNSHDRVLGFAGLLWKPDMLGKHVGGPSASMADTSYIELSTLGVNHRYFVPAGQNNQKSLNTFFLQALNGESVNLNPLAERVELNGIVVHRLLPNTLARLDVGDAQTSTSADKEGTLLLEDED